MAVLKTLECVNMTAVNWSEQFAGFSDVGTIISTFVTNLIIGLLPVFVVLLVLGIIGACGYGVVKLITHGMGGMKFRK